MKKKLQAEIDRNVRLQAQLRIERELREVAEQVKATPAAPAPVAPPAPPPPPSLREQARAIKSPLHRAQFILDAGAAYSDPEPPKAA